MQPDETLQLLSWAREIAWCANRMTKKAREFKGTDMTVVAGFAHEAHDLAQRLARFSAGLNKYDR